MNSQDPIIHTKCLYMYNQLGCLFTCILLLFSERILCCVWLLAVVVKEGPFYIIFIGCKNLKWIKNGWNVLTNCFLSLHYDSPLETTESNFGIATDQCSWWWIINEGLRRVQFNYTYIFVFAYSWKLVCKNC